MTNEELKKLSRAERGAFWFNRNPGVASIGFDWMSVTYSLWLGSDYSEEQTSDMATVYIDGRKIVRDDKFMNKLAEELRFLQTSTKEEVWKWERTSPIWREYKDRVYANSTTDNPGFMEAMDALEKLCEEGGAEISVH